MSNKLSDHAAALLDLIKAGERIEAITGDDTHDAANELMKAGLIETQALVWETRVCYVPAGLDPRREALETVLNEMFDYEDRHVDRILAVLS